MKRITPQDVLNEAQRDATLQVCVEMWQRGDTTWEQAMMIAAVMLARQYAALIERAQIPPAPIIIKVSQEQFDVLTAKGIAPDDTH